MFNKDEFEDENEFGAPMEPMTRTASPVNLRSYLEDLYKKKNLGDDERMKLEQSVAETKPGAGLTFLASLGAGLAGQDQGKAVDSLNQGSRDAQKNLEAFDAKRKGAFDELKSDREIGKFEREQKDAAEMDDPESQQTKAMQTLAAKMMPQGDWTKYTARQLDKSMPYLKAAYEQELSAAKEKYDREFKEKELGVKSQETKMKMDMAKEEKALAASRKLSKGEESVDRDYGKDYNDWTSGGKPAADKSINKLKEAMSELSAMNDDTSFVSGRVVGRMPDLLKSNEAIVLRDKVRSAANDALKATLGTVFTEREGERIMNQAYDERLPPSENAKRIRGALEELETRANNQEAKARYFEENGSLKGYKGAGSASVGQKTVPGKVRVTNGKETLEIDEADLEDAKKDGFKVAG